MADRLTGLPASKKEPAKATASSVGSQVVRVCHATREHEGCVLVTLGNLGNGPSTVKGLPLSR